MATTDETRTADPWARYCLLMECRHFNRIAGNDPEGRRWERDNAPELAQLETRFPDFVMRFCQKALAEAAAAAPDIPAPIRHPRGRPAGGRDFRSRQANDD
jgi:hypothetical protein